MIHPIVLCGGAGARLWPLSRIDRPKQFAPLFDGETLLDRTLQRFQGVGYAPPVILTHKDTLTPVYAALERHGITDATIIAEPAARGNAPAILAALCDPTLDPEAMLLVAASDHVLHDLDGFHAAVDIGTVAASSGQIITFGVTPDRPETGYGYLEPETPVRPGDPAQPLRRFIEKPNLDSAKSMIARGNVLWNSGIFLFRAADMQASFDQHAPHLLGPCQEAMARATCHAGALFLDPESYVQAEDISLDYAVLEKAQNLSVVALESDWSDLGTWPAIWAELPADADGVVTTGQVQAQACRNSLLRAEDAGPQLVGIGLENIVAVATADAVLVAHMDQSPNIGAIARQLQDPPEALAPAPSSWGWQENLFRDPGLHIFRLVLRPGAVLPTAPPAGQWIVHQGRVRVTDGADRHIPGVGSSIPGSGKNSLRFENFGKEFVYMIGISIGSGALDEDPDAPSQTQRTETPAAY